MSSPVIQKLRKRLDQGENISYELLDLLEDMVAKFNDHVHYGDVEKDYDYYGSCTSNVAVGTPLKSAGSNQRRSRSPSEMGEE